MPGGQHEAGKHSAAGKKRAADNPRAAKGKPAKATKTTAGTGNVYSGKKKGIIRKILGL